MEFLNIIYLNSLSCLTIILNGIAFRKAFNFENVNKNFLEAGLYGLISISFITFIANFVFKISNIMSIFILIIPILFVLKQIIPKTKELLLMSILLGLISSFIMYLDNTNRPDAGLYHLPFINIINDSKIIIGSANLEFRFGHTSVLQYLSAAFNNNIFSENGILLPQANIFSIVVLYFLNLLKVNNTYLKLFFFIFLFNILYSMNRYSGFGNDDPAHMFYFLSICNLVYFYFDKDKNKIKNIIFFSLFAFLIKPFLILVFIFPLILLIDKETKIFTKTNIFCLLIIIFWGLKNILISSCALYPVSLTCIKNVEWTTYKSRISNPERASRTSEAWAKDWPNKNIIIDQSEYIKKFRWVETWKKNHFNVFLNEIIPQLILIFLIIIFFPNILNNNNIDRSLKIKIFFVGLISFSLWFIKFPIYRYGQAYIITFINSLMFFPFFKNIRIFNFNNENVYRLIKYFLVFIFLGIILKNINRINEKIEYKYINYPWPKMYSFTKQNKKNKNLKVISENGQFLYYKPNPYSLCMYSQSPCTSNLDVGKIKKKIVNGYTIFHY